MNRKAMAKHGIDVICNGKKNERGQDESTCGNRLDVGRGASGGFGSIPAEPLAGASHRTAGWNQRCMVYCHCCRCYGDGLDTELWR